VPTKKQRRRQQKNRRHEWEYVYVDDEGHEVEVDPDELRRSRDDQKKVRPRTASPSAGATTRGGRQGRQIQPPSWRRVGKRALILAPVFVIMMMVLNRNQPVATWILPTAFLLLFFIPFSYYMDSFAYRMYRKRLDRAQAASAKAGPKAKTR
jgi:hypothetical protein